MCFCVSVIHCAVVGQARVSLQTARPAVSGASIALIAARMARRCAYKRSVSRRAVSVWRWVSVCHVRELCRNG